MIHLKQKFRADISLLFSNKAIIIISSRTPLFKKIRKSFQIMLWLFVLRMHNVER